MYDRDELDIALANAYSTVKILHAVIHQFTSEQLGISAAAFVTFYRQTKDMEYAIDNMVSLLDGTTNENN